MYKTVKTVPTQPSLLQECYLPETTLPGPDRWPAPSPSVLTQPLPAQIPGLGNRPVTAGHGYSTLAWIPQEEGSWALPLLHERVTPQENALDKAATQLARARTSLPQEVEVIGMYDSQYG